MFIEDMSHKAAMSPEPLTSHHIPHAFLLLCHVPDMVPTSIIYNVSIGLLKSSKNRNVLTPFF